MMLSSGNKNGLGEDTVAVGDNSNASRKPGYSLVKTIILVVSVLALVILVNCRYRIWSYLISWWQ